MKERKRITINDWLMQRSRPVRYWEAANYILTQYSDEPNSYLIPDHCREEALLMFATMMCRSHVGKTRESLYTELLKVNGIYLQNPLTDHDVYEIAEDVYYKEQKLRKDVLTKDDTVNLFFNSKIDIIE
jgi:hypothetical protein